MTAARATGMQQLGRYRLVREIGQGSTATVFEAEHVELGKRVALKVLHPHLAQDATAAERFLREGRAASRIDHPNVVEVFDVGADGGCVYLVMELLDGVDLATHLRERGQLSPAETADRMLPVVAAVSAAHAAGVIHRDLKPGNVLLARGPAGEPRPTVLDFGISKMTAEHERDLTASQALLGTVHYMSPEQTRGARNGGALGDVYALGVILYECVSGRKPFAGASPYALMHAIVSAKVAPPSAFAPPVPAAFDDLVLRAMHRDPARRFAAAAALGAALLPWASEAARARWVAELQGHAAPAATPARGKHARRGAALLAAVAIGLGVYVLRTAPGPVRPVAGPPAPRAMVAVAEQRGATIAPGTDPSASPPPHDGAPSAAPATLGPPTQRTVTAPHAAPIPATTAEAGHAPERGTNGALILE